VYVVGHGWHVGLAVRPEDVSPDVWPEAVELGRFAWIEVGWGDGDFYPTGSGTLALAVRAAFASTASVLHVAGLDRPVPQAFLEAPLVEVRLSREGLDRLSRFVHDTYARDDANRPIVVGRGLYAESVFYRARGTYRWSNNSNQWVARALRAAGCPLEPALSLNAGSVLAQVSRIGRVIHPPTGAGVSASGPGTAQPDCA
jgi:uncharacterized protein (TIGR02117 family)